ncbi:LOW QUALITY PROTEIN: hypothetical protein MC885_013766, partial [Smutsia gigantea]
VPYWVKSRLVECPGSCSRESTAGGSCSGTATTGTLADVAAGARAPRRTHKSAWSGRGCREWVSGAALSPGVRPCPLQSSPRPLRRFQPLRLTGVAHAGVGGVSAAAPAREARTGSPPCRAGDRAPGSGCGSRRGPSGPPPRPAA